MLTLFDVPTVEGHDFNAFGYLDFSPVTEAAPTYNVTYDANGATGGSVPVDEGEYAEGSSVVALSNSGGLSLAGHLFAGWNTAADGSGTNRAVGASFAMPGADLTLYARWIDPPEGDGGKDGARRLGIGLSL